MEITNCKAVKLIAVSEKPEESYAAALKKILEYCGYTVTADADAAGTGQYEYWIAHASALTGLPTGVTPSVLLLVDFAHVAEEILSRAKDFTACVTDYDTPIPLSADYLTHCNMLSYSAESDNADFTARNIHATEQGIAFEIVGVGVIGRVKLNEPELVKTSLVAASAALACGIPFADVLSALNNM